MLVIADYIIRKQPLTLSTNIILILPPVEQVGPVVAVGQLIVEVGEAELVDIVWAVLVMKTGNPLSRVTCHVSRLT